MLGGMVALFFERDGRFGRCNMRGCARQSGGIIAAICFLSGGFRCMLRFYGQSGQAVKW